MRDWQEARNETEKSKKGMETGRWKQEEENGKGSTDGKMKNAEKDKEKNN